MIKQLFPLDRYSTVSQGDKDIDIKIPAFRILISVGQGHLLLVLTDREERGGYISEGWTVCPVNVKHPHLLLLIFFITGVRIASAQCSFLIPHINGY